MSDFDYSILFVTLISIAVSCGERVESPSTLFFKLTPDITGIDFTNHVIEGDQFNILTYRNFYNGGGVAIGDINNDGLPDIYFISNMGSNKLYLNLGNWTFEDITDQAGVAGTRSWSTGVTMTDVNGDGWIDIYVCNSGDVPGDDRRNELFINNGLQGNSSVIPTFSEEAASYNLDDDGFSTHASFFDFDLDGDLDCYILNNSYKDPQKIDLFVKSRTETDEFGGDKLFRNDGEVFVDVTLEAGIYKSAIGFGLGVSVSDLNGDLFPDIYISNDFWERDYLYLNNGDGTFSEVLTERIDLCSVSSMGSDVADLNNDGTYEIFITDMLAADNYRLKAMTVFDPYQLEDSQYRESFHYQILQNSLQLNDGNANFQEIAHFSGVAATDWSWGALIFDFDNDGWKDIFVSNGIFKDIMYLDFNRFINNQMEVKRLVTESGQFDWRDFSRYIPSNPISNFAFTNNRDLTFRNATRELGLSEPVFSNGCAYGDLDQDGDLDLVVNNVNMPSFIYRNMSVEQNGNNYLKLRLTGSNKNPLGIGAEVRIETRGQKQVLQNFTARGFQSSVEPGLLFGLCNAEHVDKLTIVWPDRSMQILENVPVNQVLTLYQTDADQEFKYEPEEVNPLFKDVTDQLLNGDYTHRENRYNDFDHEPLLPRMLSTEGPKIVKGDVNNDGLEDFILLGATDDPDKLFIQQSDGTFKQSVQSVFEADRAFESTAGAIFDADGDGDNDLLIGAGGNEYYKGIENFILRYYENDGSGIFARAIEKTPPAAGNVSCILVDDIDLDGDYDLFIGSRCVPGHYGLPPRSFLLRNDGDSKWTDITPQDLGGFGMITDGVWYDVDQDGYKDLILVGEWMPVIIFKNGGSGITGREIVPGSFGWWNCIEPNDLDGDGDVDFVLGNWGLNTKFKASTSRPITMFVKDFDNDNKPEFIINWYPPLDNRSYPFATKTDLVKQLPHLNRSILKFEDYANKTYETLFSEQERENAISYMAEYMESAIIWNEDGAFRLEALPDEAQISPVFGIIVCDLNEDGHKDIWLGGNFYGLTPQVGRHDSSHGVTLLGNGQGDFNYLPSGESGLLVKGEVRDAVTFDIEGSTHIMVARNNASVLVFKQ